MQYLQCFRVIYALKKKKKINSSRVLIISSLQIKLYEKQREKDIGMETGFTFIFMCGFACKKSYGKISKITKGK